MSPLRPMVLAILIPFAVAAAGCSRATDPTAPNPTARALADTAGELCAQPNSSFASVIDNPYLPMIPGTAFQYSGTQNGDPEIDRMHVTHRTKKIQGVTCTVVLDSAYVSGVLEEATEDWFAQDSEGNVWYFGEDTKELDASGNVTSTEGSWKAGVDGAKPGIVMKDDPDVGDRYRQEFAEDVAEDMAKVVGLDTSVKVPYGSFKRCLVTRETSPLEPGVAEKKYYARGVGMLKAITVAGGADESELVRVWHE